MDTFEVRCSKNGVGGAGGNQLKAGCTRQFLHDFSAITRPRWPSARIRIAFAIEQASRQ